MLRETGYLEINSNAGTGGTATATLAFAAGIVPGQITATADAKGNLYLKDGVTGDEIKIDYMMSEGGTGSSQYGVQTVTFADGTTLTAQQVRDLADTASTTNTTLYGFRTTGTFTYAAGSGQVEIDADAGWATGTAAVLQLGGIDEAQVSVSTDSSGNLYLTDGTAGDRIELASMMDKDSGAQEYGVGEVAFADGAVLSGQQLIDLATTGSPTKTKLYGTAYAETFDSRGYATYEQGGGGSDTFIYNTGYGNLEISDYNDGWWNSSASVLQFGTGIGAAQITITLDSSGDLYMTDGVTGDQVKLDGELDNSWNNVPSYGVASVEFADGTSLNRQQLILLATTGGPTNTILYGTPDADTFDSRGYATYEQGNGGADTFIYNLGYGSLEINEQSHNDVWWGASPASTAVLQFGSGISATQIGITGDSEGNIYLTDGLTGDQIKIDGELNSSWADIPCFGVASVEFSDGTSLTRQQVIGLETTGSPTNATLYGSVDAEIFDSKGYATYEQGNGGADTFVYDVGYGVIEINEGNGGNASTAVLQFGAGIIFSQISVTVDDSNDLCLDLADGATNDQIKIDYGLNVTDGTQPSFGVACVQFSDGTSMSWQQLVQIETIGSSTNTKLYGSSQADVFDSRGYATYAQGDGGDDTFIYRAGYGILEINETENSINL